MDLTNNLIILLRCILLDTIDQPSKLRRASSIICVLVILKPFISCTLFAIDPSSDWKTTVLSITLASVTVIILIKIFTLSYYADSIVFLIRTIQNDIPVFMKGRHNLISKHNKASKMANSITWVFFSMGISVEMSFLIKGVFYGDEKNIIIPQLGLLVPNNGFFYKFINTLFQLNILQIAVCVTTANNGFIYYFMLHCQSGFDILVSSLDYLNIEHNIDEQLFEIVKYQYCLDRFIRELRLIYSFQINFQILYSILMLCFTLQCFDSNMLFMIAPSVVMVICEIFLICYFGQLIIDKSEMVCDALYAWPHWMDVNLRTRRHLLLMMAGSQRPKHISSGFVNLSLPTFLSAMKMSYSFYTLLRTTEISDKGPIN